MSLMVFDFELCGLKFQIQIPDKRKVAGYFLRTTFALVAVSLTKDPILQHKRGAAARRMNDGEAR